VQRPQWFQHLRREWAETLPSGFFEPDGTPVPADQLRLTAAIDFADYVSSEGRFTRLLACYQLAENRESVVVELDCEVPQKPKVDVRKRERMQVTFYPKDKRPPDVRALRNDFPRDCVIHLNLDSRDKPASLCLFAEPWEEVRIRLTGAGLAERIRMWVADTATGELHRKDQALEPFTLGPSSSLIISHGLFWDLVKGRANTDRLAIIEIGLGRFSVVENRHGRSPSGALRSALVVAPVSKPHKHCSVHSNPNNLAELAGMLSDPAVGIDLSAAIATAILSAASSNRLESLGFIAVIALLLRQREEGSEPEPEIAAFFGLTGNAGNQGLVPFAKSLGVLSGDPTRPINASALSDVSALKLRTFFELDSDSAADYSGLVPQSNKLVAIGGGALGSQVLMNSVRGGIVDWTVIDDDHLLPHNLVRHALTGTHLGHAKASALATAANSLLDTDRVRGIVANVLRPGPQGEAVAATLRGADAIVDMSASIAVARHLTEKKGVTAKRCSIFLNPTGTDLVFLGEDSGRVFTLDSLEMQYYRAVASDESFKGHLKAAQLTSYAASCRDVTSRVPQELMNQHAGQATRILRSWLASDSAILAVQRTDVETGAVSALRLAPESPVRSGTLGEWTVRTDNGLLDELRRQRLANLPNETGGVLIGVFDFVHHVIHVVHQIPAPPDSQKQPTVYIRGSEGLKDEFARLQKETLNTLTYVGEWHSHPEGNACRPSSIDVEAAVWLSDQVRLGGAPGLMLIVGDGDDLCWVFCSRLLSGQAPETILPTPRRRK